MALDSYANLQTAVAAHLNRSDDTDLLAVLPDLVDMVEARFKREPRLRSVATADLTVSGDDTQLPALFRELISLYHDGSTYYGALEIVQPDQLGDRKYYLRDGGPPLAAAVIATSGTKFLRVAPVPSQSYTLKLIYSVYLDPLSATNTTNWILELAPDIYMYALLAEASAWLQEDGRVGLWEQKLEDAIQKHYINHQRESFGGMLTRFPAQAIGGQV